MTADAEQHQSKHTCPECGGDVTRTRDRYPFTTHGTRAYLWLTFFVIVAGYVITLLLVSNIGRQVTNYAALANPNASTTPIPFSPPVDAETPSDTELRMAIEGDGDSLALMRSQIRRGLEGENYYRVIQHVQRLRLEVHNPETTINSVYGFSFFGRHVNHSVIREVRDPRTLVPAYPGSPGRSVTYQTWWPGYHVQISYPAGVQRTYSLSYIGIMGLLTLLVFVSWVVSRCVPARWHRGRVRWLALCVLVLFSIACAAFTREAYSFNMGTYVMPMSSGVWVEAERVREALDDDDALRSLLAEMRSGLDVSPGTPAAIVVGREYLNPEPDPALPKAVTTDWWGWWVLRQGSIDVFSVRTTRYDGDRTADQLRAASRTPFWDHLYHWGRARYEWHRPRSTVAFDFNVPHIALVLGFVWWAWVVLSSIHRVRTWRVQRKRVNRGQCIYCGYRGSDEALAARWA